jgi:hypothetical protein
MHKTVRWLWALGFFGVLATANAQAQEPATVGAAFDGTYQFVSSARLNATYVDRNGRTGPCLERRAGPLHIANGQVRYTTATGYKLTGYKLTGTVEPQGELTIGLIAPSNSRNAGSQPLNLNVTGQIDGDGTVRASLITNQCNFDLIWRKVPK